MGWVDADLLIRKYALHGDRLIVEGSPVWDQDHFRAASVQIFLNWCEVTLDYFKCLDRHDAYKQIKAWYSEILSGPVWNELLREKTIGVLLLFEKHEAGYRELFGEQ